jgi:hypothetical protein
MELDDFKHAWQAAAPSADPPLDAARIRELLRRRSHSALAKLRRNLLLEGLSSLVGIPVMLYWSWQADSRIQVLLGLAALLAGGLAVALLYFRWRVGSPDPALPLLDQLRSTVGLTERYLRLYERSLVGLTLVALALGFGVGLIKGSKVLHAASWLPRPGWRALLIASASLVIGFFITTGIYRLTLHFFYGRHLRTLRTCLAELEEPAT